MSENAPEVHSGGCQCGAVRYRIEGAFENPHICHCRMCQKAFGNYFAALVGVKKSSLAWTKGMPSFFRSSPAAQRGFCKDCGTPLSIADDESATIDIAIGSLDQPEAVTPGHQYGTESRLPAFALLHKLDGSRTEDILSPEALQKYRSLQHPDHD